MHILEKYLRTFKLVEKIIKSGSGSPEPHIYDSNLIFENEENHCFLAKVTTVKHKPFFGKKRTYLTVVDLSSKQSLLPEDALYQCSKNNINLKDFIEESIANYKEKKREIEEEKRKREEEEPFKEIADFLQQKEIDKKYYHSNRKFLKKFMFEKYEFDKFLILFILIYQLFSLFEMVSKSI